MATTWRQDDFRFRNDDGDQANATWKDSAHVNITAVLSGSTYKFRIRIAASEQGSTAGTLTAYLYAQKNGSGGYTRVTSSRSDGLKVVDSANLTDDAATTQQISSVTYVAGKVDDVDGTCTATGSIARYSGTEHEFMLQIDAASVNHGDYFDIREYASTSAFTTYTYTPRITISKPIELTGAGNIAGAEAFGTPTATLVTELTNAGNIAGSEAVGTPVAQAGITTVGIASLETIGQAQIQLDIVCVGVSGAEIFGIPTVEIQSEPIELTNAGNIAGAEFLGNPVTSLELAATGIIGQESIGAPEVNGAINTISISSLEQMGVPVVTLSLNPNNIAGLETFGTPIVEAESEEKNLYPVGIDSQAECGQPGISSSLSPVSIISMEACGISSVGLLILAVSIASIEAIGLATILSEANYYNPQVNTPDIRRGRLVYTQRVQNVPSERVEKVKA